MRYDIRPKTKPAAMLKIETSLDDGSNPYFSFLEFKSIDDLDRSLRAFVEFVQVRYSGSSLVTHYSIFGRFDLLDFDRYDVEDQIESTLRQIKKGATNK